MKGKRPFYVITRYKYYEGDTEYWVEYIGTNYKAACARYNMLYDYIYQTEFVDQGIDEERISKHQDELPKAMAPGEWRRSYVDDDELYMNVELRCYNTGFFQSSRLEERYREIFPNAKY